MIDSCKRGSFIYDVVSVDFGYLCFDQHVIKLKFVQVCNFFSDLKKKKIQKLYQAVKGCSGSQP